LSEESSTASEASEEIEPSPSYVETSVPAIVEAEESVTMPPMDAEKEAEFKAEIEDLHRKLNSKESDLNGAEEHIKRIEDQAREFEEKLEAERKVSAEWKAQLEKANLEIKAREEDIYGEKGLRGQLEEAQKQIDEDLGPELKQQIQFNKNLKEELEAAKGLVKFYKEEANAVAQESSALIKKGEQIEKQVETRKVAIEQLNEQLGDVAHFEDDLYQHQQILEDTVKELNKSVDDGPKFNPHPEAYVAPDTDIPTSQTLSDQLSGMLSTSGDSSSFQESDFDSDSDHTAEVKDPANANAGIEDEREGIAEDHRILDQKLRQVELVEIEIKVPVEEVTIVPARPAPVSIPTASQPPQHVPHPVPSAPAVPEFIIQKIDRVVYNGKDVHSWSHIERDFLVLVLAFFNYFTGTLWPSLTQAIRGTAPISDHPIPVPGSEDGGEAETGDHPEPASVPQAMVNSTIASSAPGPSAPMDNLSSGSDPIDTQVETGLTNIDDLLSPLPSMPDRRESIALAPPASPPRRPASSSNNGGAATNSHSRTSPTGNGNGDRSGPPGPPSGDGSGSSPPGPPNGDGFGDLPAATPGFWDIFAPRPLPSIKWTLVGMLLHLVVYYCVYLTIDTYFERNLWLAANDATRQWLHSIMGVRYTDGILRKIISEAWATRIDRSLLYAVTKAGIMELKTFPMPG